MINTPLSDIPYRYPSPSLGQGPSGRGERHHPIGPGEAGRPGGVEPKQRRRHRHGIWPCERSIEETQGAFLLHELCM